MTHRCADSASGLDVPAGAHGRVGRPARRARNRDSSLADNPLRINGRLRAVNLCEYGAQAMAVHGGLRGTVRASTEAGLLVSLRGAVRTRLRRGAAGRAAGRSGMSAGGRGELAVRSGSRTAKRSSPKVARRCANAVGRASARLRRFSRQDAKPQASESDLASLIWSRDESLALRRHDPRLRPHPRRAAGPQRSRPDRSAAPAPRPHRPADSVASARVTISRASVSSNARPR